MRNQIFERKAVPPRRKYQIFFAALTIVLSAIASGDSRSPRAQGSVEAKVSIERRGTQVTFAWHRA